MTINLRPYQVRTLEELDAWFEENETGNPIVHACVGAGKSVMIAEFCRRAVLDYPGYRARILMLVPSKELLLQNYEKLSPLMFDMYIGIISASAGRKDTAYDKDVVIATVGSVAKNPGMLGRLDLIIVDECHLISRKDTGQYRKLIADCKRYNPQLRVIGLTGTPYRGDGIWLTEGKERLFTDIASRVTMRELLDAGYLSPLVNAETETHIDASTVRMQNGDFMIHELAKRIDQDGLTQTIAQQIVELGKDRAKWLVYCVTVEHAGHMAEALKTLGISVAVVSANTPAAERDRIIKDFKAGRVRCICNVAVLTTGFDVPELDLIALVRNTRSPVLYTQIAGRGMRIAEGKQDCLWLDFTDTTLVMGPVDQIKGRAEPKPTNKADGESVAPFKVCPECGASVATAVLKCPTIDCGYEFPPPATNVNGEISNANVLTKIGFNTYNVVRVTYSEHQNRKDPSKPPTLKVTYWSGMKPICSEWVCIEHSGFARVKAERWWYERINAPIPLPKPLTVVDALAQTEWLRTPGQIVVREGEQWPELIRCIFNDETTDEEAA